MRAVRLAVLLPLIAGGLTAGGAAAETPDGAVAPAFAESSVFFRCTGGDAMKVQNASGPVGWTAEAPTRSVTAGAGCGFGDVGELYNAADASRAPEAEPYDPVFEGTMTGNLKSVTADLYLLGTTNEIAAFGGTMSLFVWLAVDGKTVYYGPDVVEVPAEAVNDGRGQRLRFRLTDLDGVLPVEPGNGTTEHTVTLSVAPWYTDDNAAWAWDTVEVPAGLVFNDDEPGAVDVRVRPGDGG